MKLLTGLFRVCRKALMTTDNDMGAFRQKLDELVSQKDTLQPEDIEVKVEELKTICNDLPDDEGKAELLRYLEDFKAIKEQDEGVAKKAAEVVANQFEKLDTAAMQGISAETTAEEPVVEEVTTEEIAEETTAPEETGDADEVTPETTAEGDAEDADPNAEYSLEEIYQFIKKRMAEDAACDKEQTEDDGDEIEEEQEEVVTDNAPRIPVTVNDSAAKGDLFSLVEMAKGRK